MTPELSIIMPAIRTNMWVKVYESILNATKRNFELIIISPYALPTELEKYQNIKLIRDWGSPTRCSQLGTLFCEGKFLYLIHADDSFFIKDSIDNNMDFLLSLGGNAKNIVLGKYSESQNFSAPERYQPDDYYKIVNAYPVNRQFIPDSWWIFNTIIMYREYFEWLGGYDCIYEACPMAQADLAIRAQKDGANVKMSNFPLTQGDHLPGGSGDHMPVFIQQTYHDHPKFAAKYNQPLDNLQIQINQMNWKKAEKIWTRRFPING